MNRQYVYGALAIVSSAVSADVHADDEHSGIYLGAGAGRTPTRAWISPSNATDFNLLSASAVFRF